jgi:predicted N-acetyltransferase YhbS
VIRALRLRNDELAADELERFALEDPEVYEPVVLDPRPAPEYALSSPGR